MKIDYTKKFTKQFQKQPKKVQESFYRRLELFKYDEYAPALRNHTLKGEYLGCRSIDVTGDVRALYVKRGSTIVIFAFIGSHSQLYR